jgi:heme-degrading monooxygenase HmoA
VSHLTSSGMLKRWEDRIMMTIVTRVTLKEGSRPECDAAMCERLDAARNQPGWIGGQLLIPLIRLDKGTIIRAWETRAAWEGWHRDPNFAETGKRLEGLEADACEHWWHEVVLRIRPS